MIREIEKVEENRFEWRTEMKKSILVIGGVLIAAGAILGWRYYGSHQKVSDENLVYVSAVSEITGTSSGIVNRYAGVVEPQQTVEINLENGRSITEVQVEVGEEVKVGQLLFEYDLSSIEDDLKQANLDLDRLKNEAISLQTQIQTLEKEKKKASSELQLSYTIEIETNKMNLKKNEYDQISKTAEIEKLKKATGNTEVRSEINGIIQKIDTSKIGTENSMDDGMDYSSSDNFGGDESGAFITILSTGAYRIKGSVNEQNISSLSEGMTVIIRSRVDESLIWRGMIEEIDRDNRNSDDSSAYMYSYGDAQTTSSTYPFYVALDSSEGLMLGQHVYIEPDYGQADKKEGLWLSEFYIADLDQENPYVWAAGEKNRLEKKFVILGNYDADLGEYEILQGLTLKDCITFPDASLSEGMPTTDNEELYQSMQESNDSDSDLIDMDMSEEDMEVWNEEYEILEEDMETWNEEYEILEEDMDIIEEDMDDAYGYIEEEMGYIEEEMGYIEEEWEVEEDFDKGAMEEVIEEELVPMDDF